MEIMIDIDDDLYKSVVNNDAYVLEDVDWILLENAIANSTPLPKGHGDLIDRSTLEPDTEWSDWDDGWISYSYRQIADADVIIKADGGGEDEVSD